MRNYEIEGIVEDALAHFSSSAQVQSRPVKIWRWREENSLKFPIS
jgi:hypothetical protein